MNLLCVTDCFILPNCLQHSDLLSTAYKYVGLSVGNYEYLTSGFTGGWLYIYRGGKRGRPEYGGGGGRGEGWFEREPTISLSLAHIKSESPLFLMEMKTSLLVIYSLAQSGTGVTTA